MVSIGDDGRVHSHGTYARLAQAKPARTRIGRTLLGYRGPLTPRELATLKGRVYVVADDGALL